MVPHYKKYTRLKQYSLNKAFVSTQNEKSKLYLFMSSTSGTKFIEQREVVELPRLSWTSVTGVCIFIKIRQIFVCFFLSSA